MTFRSFAIEVRPPGPLVTRGGRRGAWTAPGAAAAVAGGTSLAMGVAVAHSGRVVDVVVALVFGAVLLVLVSSLGIRVLTIWIPLNVALYPFARYPSQHPYLTFDRAWIAASMGCLLLGRQRLARDRVTRRMFTFLALFAAAFGLRALTTHDSQGHLTPVLIWIDAIVLPLVLFAVARRFVRTREGCLKIGRGLTIAGAILGSVGVGEHFLGFQLASLSGGTVRYDSLVNLVRISGPYGVPEVFALALLICLGGTLYFLQARPGRRLLGVLVVAVEVLALAFTLFRTAWISALVVLVLAVGIRPKRHARSFAVVFTMAVVGALAVSQLEQNGTFAERAGNTRNIQGRFATYQQAWTLFRGSPYVGVGVSQYTSAAMRLPETSVAGVASEPYPHDSFLGVLAEQGVLGFVPAVLAAAFVFRFVRAFRQRASTSLDVLFAVMTGAVAAAYLLMSLPLQMLPYAPTNAMFALVLGAAAGRFDAVGRGEDVDDTAAGLA